MSIIKFSLLVLVGLYIVACTAQPQNTSSPQAIVDTCYAFLLSHQLIGTKWGLPYHFYRPSLEKYGPDQWLWDSGSHMIVWTHKNVTNSVLDLRTMLQFQQPNGRIPEIINWGPQTESDIIQAEAMYSSYKWVDLTQMPVLPYSVKAMWDQTQDLSILKEFVPSLVRYLDWWRTTRDANGDYLVSIFHGWESGLDSSPIYDPSYGLPPEITHPKWAELYPHFLEFIFYYKLEYDWNQTAMLERKHPALPLSNYFIVQDVGINSVYASGWGVLSDLAANFDKNLSAYCKQHQINAENAIISKLWSSQLNRFISTYTDRDGHTQVVDYEVVQSLFPLLLQSISPAMVNTIVTTQLTNASKFWLSYPVPSVSASDARFNPVFVEANDLMWRGPTWPILNWFVMEGLSKKQIYNTTMNELLDRWISLYEKSGVWEQYNPETGVNYGVEGLGMSTLIVDWLYRLGRV